MKILLLGEYSNVHWTLAEGLRQLGHRAIVLSNGDFWKDYPRDISLIRHTGKWGGIRYLARLYRLLPQLKGYDVVQLINPMFLELKAERVLPVYRYLRRHNGRMILGAYGMDYYWVHENDSRKPLRYSDFNFGDQLRQDPEAARYRTDWIGTAKERLNRLIAEDCDGIVAGLYEYWACYQPRFPQKTHFVPFPIHCDPHPRTAHEGKLKLFIGLNRPRSVYKGTDIMLQAARDVARRHADKVDLRIAENVPFAEYRKLILGSDAILDQLYSYTPSMNPLEAMSHGIICIGGGEPENYEILGEKVLRPIINVQPTYESVYHELEQLALHPERIARLKQESVEYIRRHHDFIKVARAYEKIYGL